MKDLKNETLPCRPKEHTGDRCTSYRSSRKHSASHGGSHICEGPKQWFQGHAAFHHTLTILKQHVMWYTGAGSTFGRWDFGNIILNPVFKNEQPPRCTYTCPAAEQKLSWPSAKTLCCTEKERKQESGAGAGPHLSLSLSSCLVRLQSCRVSSCWVTSSAHRQFTSSLSCSGALNIGGNIMLMLHTTHSTALQKKGHRPAEH